jgi:hypothetical protein
LIGLAELHLQSLTLRGDAGRFHVALRRDLARLHFFLNQSLTRVLPDFREILMDLTLRQHGVIHSGNVLTDRHASRETGC